LPSSHEGKLDSGGRIGNKRAFRILREDQLIGIHGRIDISCIEIGVAFAVLGLGCQSVERIGSNQKVIFDDGLLVFLIEEEQVAEGILTLFAPFAGGILFDQLPERRGGFECIASV